MADMDEIRQALQQVLEENAATAVREVATIRPGDHLIVRMNTDARMNLETIDKARGWLKDMFPQCSEVSVIVADGLYVIREDDLRGVSDHG